MFTNEEEAIRDHKIRHAKFKNRKAQKIYMLQSLFTSDKCSGTVMVHKIDLSIGFAFMRNVSPLSVNPERR